MNESSTRPALRRRVEGVWTPISWKEWWEDAERVAAGLIERGVNHGDRVLLLSETRVEWVICDIAIQMAGAITVPVYPSLSANLTQEIAADSGAVAAIVSNPLQAEKLVVGRETLGVRDLFWIDAEAVEPRIGTNGRIALSIDQLLGEQLLGEDDRWNVSLEELNANGRRVLAEDSTTVSQRRRAVAHDDIASIVYTSGTSGRPRGVVLSHANLAHQAQALTQLGLLRADDVQFLFLPLAHIFARVMYLAAVGAGVETAIGDDLRALLADMQEVEPTFFAAVPQVFEQVRARLERDAQRGPVQEQLFRVAEFVGTSTERARRLLDPRVLRDRVARAVINRVQPDRARQLFGGKVRYAVSGGAPLNTQTMEFFAAFGVQVLEGYGLTETTAVSTVNLPDAIVPGAVGQAVPGVEVTIDEDGEVLIRGANVSPGYWQDDAGTAASRTPDGWLRTGDLGAFDREGNLRITGRKKELIVTAGGKNIAPHAVEAALESIVGIDRAVVVGDRRPFVVALLTLQPDAAKQWPDAALHARLTEAIDRINQSLRGYGEVRHWATVPAFSEADGTLTPTGKLRREAIASLHADTIDDLYATGGAPRR